LLLTTLIVYFLVAIFHYFNSTISKCNEAPLKLSDAEERLHLLRKSTKVSGAMSTPPFLYQSQLFTKKKLLQPRPILRKHFKMVRL